MTLVYVVTSYCLPRSDGCESVKLENQQVCELEVTRNNAFRYRFRCCWHENVKPWSRSWRRRKRRKEKQEKQEQKQNEKEKQEEEEEAGEESYGCWKDLRKRIVLSLG